MFRLERSSANNLENLKVETPFPVTGPVWDCFVLRIFPKLIYPDRYPESVRDRQPAYFDKDTDGTGRIRDSYWVHAYLPEGERAGLQQSSVGYICVPDVQKDYIDSLMADIGAKQDEYAQKLRTLAESERAIVIAMFREYQRAVYKQPNSAAEFQESMKSSDLGSMDAFRAEPLLASQEREFFLTTLDKVIHTLGAPRIFTFPEKEITEGMVQAYSHFIK